jgi:enamine deaminase RidA (YjgF/YER057c/UK114 family)
MRKASYLFVLTALLGIQQTAGAEEVIRTPFPDSRFPIAASVEVPTGRSTVYVSGTIPPVVDPSASKDSVAAYGDTRTQTVGILTSIEKQLQAMHLGMGDVVKMQVFLVGDESQGGRMDYAGFTAGYKTFFGTREQPRLPARSTFQVAGLSNPGYRLEIEVTAVRP